MNRKIIQLTKEDALAEQEIHIRMQRELVLQKLKERGFRITKQRIAVIDSILEHECSSCKEIFYKTAKTNKKIGAATIYRTLNVLEEIGAIHRRNTYTVSFHEASEQEKLILVTLENGAVYHLSRLEWERVLRAGMQANGYGNGEKIISVLQQDVSSDCN